MKKYLIIILVAMLLSGNLLANETLKSKPTAKKGRVDLSFSQGFAWGREETFEPISYLNFLNVVFTVKGFGPSSNVDIRFRLTDTRYLNLGFSRQTNSTLVNREIWLQDINTRLVFSDYRYSVRRNFLSLTYDTRLTPNLEFEAGLSYMFWATNVVGVGLRSNQDGTIWHSVIYASNSFRAIRSDDALHLTAFARLYFPINHHVELGVRAGLHLGIIGIESVMLLPGMRVKF